VTTPQHLANVCHDRFALALVSAAVSLVRGISRKAAHSVGFGQTEYQTGGALTWD